MTGAGVQRVALQGAQGGRRAKPFLRAEWRHLAMLNFSVDPELLEPLIPRGTELDRWEGGTLLSVVGFLFLRTRIRGVPVPFHSCFEEVNLRFYVRRRAPGGWRRGVVFIKEIAPRRLVVAAARALFHENYLTLPMSHAIERDAHGRVRTVSYSWRQGERREGIEVVCAGAFEPMGEGSEEEFVAEHYWGYTARRDGSTREYAVEHPRWRVCAAERARLRCDAAALYGSRFGDVLAADPCSAFLAEGSEVEVYWGARIDG